MTWESIGTSGLDLCPLLERLTKPCTVLTSLALVLAAAGVYILSVRPLKHTPAAAVMSSNHVAYDAYMRGKVNVGSENPDNNNAAIKLFEQSVAADPNFAAAYAAHYRAFKWVGYPCQTW